jgi:outer membrane murein-binding lipoprotein Lpp
MKKQIVIGAVLLSVLLLLTSCSGISKEEYDRAKSDLAAAQAQLTTKTSELDSANNKLAQGTDRIEIINAILIPAMTGEMDNMTESESIHFFLDFRDKINAIGDVTLTAKFEALIDDYSSDAISAFFVYLLESTATALK